MGIDAEMFVRTKTEVTDEKLREWHYAFGCAFHEHLYKFGVREGRVPEDLFLYRVPVYEQDGDDIMPEPGETFLRLRPASRYYGVGYERGNFPILKAMAEFLEVLIPEAEVWYGGDSSGVCASRFGPAEREEMLRYFVQHQNNPYHGVRSSVLGRSAEAAICPYCQHECPQFGFGQKYASFTCLGCGWQHVTRDGVAKTGWHLKEHEA